MKCEYCNFCVYVGSGISGGYKCRHPRLEECVHKYETVKGKKIRKSHDHIGYKMIKTSLIYCPYRENEVNK